MFVYMVVVYGAFVLVMGIIGSEPELVALGLAMMFIGNLHRLGKITIKTRRRVVEIK
ncbi:hypothetical protein [Pyrobaculum aerophilum]|uniref:Uncharacterized protein n=2 Tax=Pyrobaculum aerophilum TaxID=13773 RepID=Q8ZYJ2_PYRAE|nr:MULTISPECIES: hypothetical protein [Pyrobaculum]AAL63001.1 hypothetical protein PAE0748 [Pyrobaculum aerophilum str. IM2]MCX8136196.1 hypothetical protein [Pyrobaculum aerophilum]HII48228.1 hypothetical protein [Pyrobaculum aerophilum]